MIPFLKMHSLGNDFIILDGRKINLQPEDLNLAQLANRNTGIGCDQVIYISYFQADLPTEQGEARPVHRSDSEGGSGRGSVSNGGASPPSNVNMRIINADGSEVEACGNATRCIGWLMMEETQSLCCNIHTQAGMLTCTREVLNSQVITANMGTPQWEQTTLEGAPIAVNIGNPHLVFFVEDADAINLTELGSKWEHHPQFPQRTNVEFVEICSPTLLKMRVWERGVGITQACGTGACASLVAGVAAQKSSPRAVVTMPGGELEIYWSGEANSAITMKGIVHHSFSGLFNLGDYAA